MLVTTLLKGSLIVLLFIVLPIALLRLMVYKTIEACHKDHR